MNTLYEREMVMATTDISRQKYVHLITQVEELETRVAELERECSFARESGQPKDVTFVEGELKAVQNQLAGARTELARVSDGCGKPHA